MKKIILKENGISRQSLNKLYTVPSAALSLSRNLTLSLAFSLFPSFLPSLLPLTLSPLIISCGGQTSDPLPQNYKALKGVPPSSEKSDTQVISVDGFMIQVDGPNPINYAYFKEGQTNEVRIRVTPKSQKTLKYSFEMVEFPLNDQPAISVTETPNVFSLKWTPPVGTIPMGKPNVSLDYTLQAIITESSDPNLVGLASKVPMVLFIVHNDGQIKIIGRTEFKDIVEEGSKVFFTIDVEDPGSENSPKMPEIQLSPYVYSNTEAFYADASFNISLDFSKKNNPEKYENNKWRFYYVLNVSNLPLNRNNKGVEDPNSNTVDLCFLYRAASVYGSLSPQLQACLKASYALQAPQVMWEQPDLKEFPAKTSQLISFMLLSEKPIGQVSLANPSKQIAKLSGTKELKCQVTSPEKPWEQRCELTWEAACVKNPKTETLTLKVDHVLDNKTKSLTITRAFSILPNTEKCQVKAPAPVKPNKTPKKSNPKPSKSSKPPVKQAKRK